MEKGVVVSLSHFLHTKNIEPLLEKLSEITSSEMVHIRILSQEFDWTPLKSALSSERFAPTDRFVAAFSETIANAVVKTKTSMDIANVADANIHSESLDDQAIKSFACFPIVLAKTAIGVIFFASRSIRCALDTETVAVIDGLAQALSYVVERERLYEDVKFRYANRQVLDTCGFITRDAYVKNALRLLPEYAESNAPVVIIGETGTGKELIAQAIHALSPRASKPIVTVHCGAIAESLIESELFGHVKGAFTGATTDKTGFFGLADGGAIFLDEISTATPEVQVRLLRVLENSAITPVGSAKQRRIDVRVIVAANEDLESMVQAGSFRKDLYYRLKVLEIYLPPLRDRRCDIAILAEYWLRHYAVAYGKNILGFTNELLVEFEYRPWEGNVRQLKHLIERLVVHASANTYIDIERLREVESLHGRPKNTPSIKIDAARYESYEEFKTQVLFELERDYLTQKLRNAEWSESPAARAMNMPRSTLISRMHTLTIKKPQLPPRNGIQ